MVFLFIMWIILIITLIILTARIEVKIVNLVISSQNKEHISDKYKIITKLKIFGNIPIIKFTLNNSNFKLKTDILSEGINQIEGNTISLAQINAGETRDIVVGIEVNKDDNFNLSMLDAESNLLLEGIYRDSTEKNISVTGERTVKLQLVSPYDEENKGIFLENTDFYLIIIDG